MAVYQRINSRKIVLSCLYEFLYVRKMSAFYDRIEQQGQESVQQQLTHQDIPQGWGEFERSLIEDVQFQSIWNLSREELSQIESSLHDKLSQPLSSFLSYQLQFSYSFWQDKHTDLSENYSFDEWKQQEIDLSYLELMCEKSPLYLETVEKAVDQHVTTFYYHEMDIMDQALFLLGMVEYSELHTPKEVLINELVELAKRFSRDGSAKMIHGIFHYLVQ